MYRRKDQLVWYCDTVFHGQWSIFRQNLCEDFEIPTDFVSVQVHNLARKVVCNVKLHQILGIIRQKRKQIKGKDSLFHVGVQTADKDCLT